MSPSFRAVGVKLMRTNELTGGSVAGVLQVAKLCDEMGIDEVHVSDHVIVTEAGHRGRPGFPYPVDYDGWFEPMALLSAIAAVTERVTLSSHVLVAPLRPTILLAKQLATLDALSNGRVHIGMGTGWQREEFEAAQIPFEARLSRLIDQIEACRALWAGAPASHTGISTTFEEGYSLPLPPQGADLRISLGLPPGPRGFAEIARLGVGYCPANYGDVPALAENITTARAAYADAGRDPQSLVVTSELALKPPRDAAGRVDWDAAFAEAAPIADAGVDVLITHVVPQCETLGDVERFLTRLLTLRD